MKVKNLLMAVAAGLALVGCNNEDANRPGETGEYGEPQYLSVNIIAKGGVGMKAGDYEDGSAEENKVNKVRFYFFKADGTSTNVKTITGEEKSYYDYTPGAQTLTPSDENVEKIVNATIVVKTQEGENVPASIIAVINPPTALGEINDIDELNDLVDDYSSTTGGFIMSNSVYVKDGKLMEEVSVAGHLYPTETAALANPVTIYVERVLAKARLTVGLTEVTPGIYSTGENYEGESIYVKFDGWNVTRTTAESPLMKAIVATWNLGWTWNTSDYFRSFWAYNPNTKSFQWGDFNGDAITGGSNVNPANAIKAFNSTGTNYTYMQENAADNATGANPAKPTQVIIAAHLVHANGDAFEIAEYGGERTTKDGVINKFAAACGLWKDKADGTGKEQIAISDITLKTPTELGMNPSEATTGNYKVYAQLSITGKGITWYKSNAEDAESITTEEANTALKNLGGAKVWAGGNTYYFFDIKHFGTGNNGSVGVVRNHVYDATIKSLVGLGTPVYNPDDIIYPEKPGDETYIAAEIKVLSWRIVKQDISLEW